jgi:hypothetical protein
VREPDRVRSAVQSDEPEGDPEPGAAAAALRALARARALALARALSSSGVFGRCASASDDLLEDASDGAAGGALLLAAKRSAAAASAACAMSSACVGGRLGLVGAMLAPTSSRPKILKMADVALTKERSSERASDEESGSRDWPHFCTMRGEQSPRLKCLLASQIASTKSAY